MRRSTPPAVAIGDGVMMRRKYLVSSSSFSGRAALVLFLGPLDHDGLQVLGAHHRAHARAARGIAAGHEAGLGGLVLAGRADGDHADLAAEFGVEHLAGLDGPFAPEGGGVLQFGFAVVNEQVHGLVGLALHEDEIVAGRLQPDGPVAAHVAVGEVLRRRRRGLAADEQPRAADHRHSGQGAGGEHEGVLRGQCLGLGRHVVPVQPGGDAAAAEEAVRVVGGGEVVDSS